MRQFTERILFGENSRPNFGKVAERKLEKLPNEIWKSCRPKSGKTAERALYRFAMCDKIRRK